MATLVVKRTSEYNNRLRDYQLFLDGKKIGTISNGEKKEFEIATGQHNVVARIDWCSSPEILVNLDDTEKKKLVVGGFKNGHWIMPIAGGIIGIGIFLNFAFSFRYGLLLAIPYFLTILYYITIGRKKYLTLTEANPSKV
ncbi:MAG TPA: hypothetical protein PKV73_07930 [Agriterribacter sp.]|nr:hypothetical protein [Chitinophagaceae bacterium]HRP31804.1 hypothetical protein [Agriterribacter sp.]